MENVIGVFGVILFLSCIALVLGMIKPSIVIKWKQEVTRKDVLKIYGIAIVVSFIIVGIFAPPVEKKEVVQEVQEKKVKQIEQAKTADKSVVPSTKKIDVVFNETIQNDNGKITITGTTTLPNNTQLIIYISSDLTFNDDDSDSVEVVNSKFKSTTFTNKVNKDKGLFNAKYKLSIRSKSYNQQPKNVQILIGKDGSNLVGKLIGKNSFNENTLAYTSHFNIKNSIDKKEIVSVTSKNLKQVIKSLKDNYSITATRINNEKLNKYEMCSYERACEVYADTIQIQAIYKSIDVLTSSTVTHYTINKYVVLQ